MTKCTSITGDNIAVEQISSLYDKGILLFCTGKYEESIKCFDKIITTNSASKIALAYKGLALQKLRKHYEAMQAYEKALIC